MGWCEPGAALLLPLTLPPSLPPLGWLCQEEKPPAQPSSAALLPPPAQMQWIILMLLLFISSMDMIPQSRGKKQGRLHAAGSSHAAASRVARGHGTANPCQALPEPDPAAGGRRCEVGLSDTQSWKELGAPERPPLIDPPDRSPLIELP